MEWAVTKLGNEFNMVNIYGVPGNGAETARDEATKAVLAENPGIKVLGEAQGNWSISDTQAAMSQLLAANGDNIDFVLSQEGADGVIRAYELAGKKLPPYNSDTTAASLRAWKDAGVDSVGVPAPCSIGAANVRFTINLLQGKKLDESKLTANPLEPSAKTAITLEPSYIVIAKEYQDAEWISNYSHSKLLTIDEAVEMVKDKPETYILDVLFEDDYIDSFFLTE
jgi:ABC-type sugar transport system substrate-binding protein